MPLEPEDLLEKKDPFEVGLTTDQAVAIIQKNERGRMNIVKADHRVQFFKASKKDASKKQDAEDPLGEPGAGGDAHRGALEAQGGPEALLEDAGGGVERSEAVCVAAAEVRVPGHGASEEGQGVAPECEG